MILNIATERAGLYGQLQCREKHPCMVSWEERAGGCRISSHQTLVSVDGQLSYFDKEW